MTAKAGKLALLWPRDVSKWHANRPPDYRLHRVFEAMAALGIEARCQPCTVTKHRPFKAELSVFRRGSRTAPQKLKSHRRCAAAVYPYQRPVCVGRPACRLICEGEGEGEYGAPVGIIVDTDISPMQPHDLLYDGEAEARAKRGSPSATPESIEDPLAVLRGNAGSLIRYAYASVLAHTHNHFCPWRGMEDCVLDEVPKCIFDRMYVPLH